MEGFNASGPDDLDLMLVIMTGNRLEMAAYISAVELHGGVARVCPTCSNAVEVENGLISPHYRFADGVSPHNNPTYSELAPCEATGTASPQEATSAHA